MNTAKKKSTSKPQPEQQSIFQRVPRWALALFILAFAVIGVYALALSDAAPKGGGNGGGKPSTAAQLYLTAPSAETTVGSTVTVELRVNPPSPADGIESSVTYDATAFEFVSTDAAASAFPVALQENGGNGMVTVVRGIFAPNTVSGDSQVTSITFKALKTARNSQLQTTGKTTYNGVYSPALTTGKLAIRIR